MFLTMFRYFCFCGTATWFPEDGCSLLSVYQQVDMASGGAVALESPVRRDLATMPSTEFSAEGLRKADSLQPRSSISLRAASSGDAGPPRHKRARRYVADTLLKRKFTCCRPEPRTGVSSESSYEF